MNVKRNISNLSLTLGLILVLGLSLGQNTAFAQTAPTPATDSGAGLNSSYNWGGYVTTGGNFSSVTGSWVVPQISSTSSLTGDATWVGIGGVTNNDLIQAGTQALTNANGLAVAYQAWYETLPGYSRPVSISVNPGDTVTASLSQQAQNQWTVTIRDNTNGQNFQTTVSYNSSQSSAEWVEEMPSLNGGALIPLDNFGTMQFSAGSTVKNGQTMTIAQSGATAMTMVNSSQEALATPSVLNTDGASFTISRSSAVAASVNPFPNTRRGLTITGINVRSYSHRPRHIRQSFYSQFTNFQTGLFTRQSSKR